LRRAGAERMVVSLARLLDRARFEVEVAALYDRTPGDFEDELDVPVRRLAKRRGPDPRMISRLACVFHDFGPDIVHTHSAKAGIMARVLQRLGSRHVLVVHGMDGMDEIAISRESAIAELKDGEISEYSVSPEQFGMSRASNELLRVGNATEACAMLCGVLDNKPGAARDIVQLNAGAAIYVAGLTATLSDGIARAAEVISDGSAKARLAQLIAFSGQF